MTTEGFSVVSPPEGDGNWHTLTVRSGGTPNDTFIYLDGAPVHDVVALTFSIDSIRPDFVKATLQFETKLDIEITGRVNQPSGNADPAPE